MTKIVVANWKMNPDSLKEAEVLFNKTLIEVKNTKNLKIVVCPPFPFLSVYGKTKNQKIALGAQNVSKEIEGSFTGEVSSKMLRSLGVGYVIVGHGEERKMGETNKLINEKILNLLKFKLSPILCIGESIRDRDGEYLLFVEEQIKSCLIGVPRASMKNIIIAYEPIWAIGVLAKREARPDEFTEMKIFIKKVISDMYEAKTAHGIPILYGGSVHKENAQAFIKEGDADGLLIGRDSINPKTFGAILRALI